MSVSYEPGTVCEKRGGGDLFFFIWIWELQWKKQPVENRGDSFISSLEKPLVWYLIDEGELFPKRVFFFFFFFSFYHGSLEEGSLSPFMCEPCFVLSPSLIVQEWAVVYCHWASTERSAKQGAGEWRGMSERQARGGGNEAAVKYETAAALIAWEPQLSNLAK